MKRIKIPINAWKTIRACIDFAEGQRESRKMKSNFCEISSQSGEQLLGGMKEDDTHVILTINGSKEYVSAISTTVETMLWALKMEYIRII